jgi:hypothetical protein
VTGSRELWRIGEEAGIVPAPPDAVLGRTLAAWWEEGRVFGCVGAKASAAWVVVLPSPAALCPTCAFEAFAAEHRCSYCHKRVRRSRATSLLFEMGPVRVMGLAHEHCQQTARKEPRT